MQKALLLLISSGIFLSSCSRIRISDSRARKDFEQAGLTVKMATYNSGGHNLHYVITGSNDKPTLFFIHGSPASWYCFENYMLDTALQYRFRIICIDRPGFGQSDHGEAHTVTEQAQIISPLIDRLQNGKPFYLIGHSLGGPLAAKLCAMHPKQVSGLCLWAAAVAPDEEDPEIWRMFVIPLPLPTACQTCNLEINSFKDDVYSITDDLHNIHCPVTIVHGLADNLVRPGNALYAQKELKNSPRINLVTIDGARHNVPWTHYDIVKNTLLALP